MIVKIIKVIEFRIVLRRIYFMCDDSGLIHFDGLFRDNHQGAGCCGFDVTVVSIFQPVKKL